MNPANPRELLTAAVDGELTPTERKAAERLLRESESARALFARLKQDAARFRNLPKMSAPPDLADAVMGEIRDRGLAPIPLPPSRNPTPRFNWPMMLPVWVSAAAVLIIISVGSFLYFSASHNYFAQQRASTTKAGDQSADPGSGPVEKGPTPKVLPTESGRSGDSVAEKPREIAPQLGPTPREVEDTRLFGRPWDVPEIQSIDLDKIRVSHFFTLRELPGDEDAGKKLLAELKKDELIRLDLFCKSTANALDLVLAGLRSKGIAAATDAFAQERLRKKQSTELVIFTEAFTPDEVAALLTALGADDKKANGAGEFDTLVVAPFLPADLNQLTRLLGLPAVTPKPPKGKAGVDIRKPLPEGTANQVAQTLTKMGGGTSPPSAAKDSKVAVVVAYAPMNPAPAASKEIKQFLDRRGERKADAKPLMLVLRLR